MIFYDCETCGLHGLAVLIQYAYDDGEVQLFDVFHEPIRDTLELIEDFMNHPEGVCGFNLTFDHFHLCKLYTIWSLLDDPDAIPLDCIDEIARKEELGIDGPCLKPVKALDLFLHARKGPFQSTMDRSDIRIRRIPTILAYPLCDELCERVKLDSLYFSRRKDDSVRWQVQDIEDEDDFKDIVLKFAPSAGLKTLVKHALGVDPDKIKLFHDVEVHRGAWPDECGWAPYNTAVTGHKPWPVVIRTHIRHWRYNKAAREYGADDVTYTRDLYKYFGCPESNDRDSILACMVASCRWRGYTIDKKGISDLATQVRANLKNLPFNPNAPHSVLAYLHPTMNEYEKESLIIDGKTTTKKIVIENIAKWREAAVCDDCSGMGCKNCDEGIVDTDIPHAAARRAQEILDARAQGKELELYNKLLQAKRFHASFKVIGALSGRMSGADGLNAQGIKSATYVRDKFPLAVGRMELTGGDFKSFEVCLADAVYGDPELRADLLSGFSMHGLFGQFLFPGMTYDDILNTKGLPGEQDKYKRSKNGVFALLYGGEAFTLSNRVGVPEEVANAAYTKFVQKYKVVGEARKGIIQKFCSMRQPNGIGSQVEWHTPDDYIESLFGFRRYFTLENQIGEALYKLAEKPPKAWLEYKIKVVRRDRIQSAAGACRSALFAAAFASQAANMRAAANHVIQSTGASLTKILQVRLWGIQPVGINNWLIQPFNVHDEIIAPAVPEVKPDILRIVDTFVEEYKEMVPLLGIDWGNDIKTWADK